MISLEMASYFNSAGSDVTVIDAQHERRHRRRHRRDVKAQSYQKGIKFQLGCRVTGISGSKVEYTTRRAIPLRLSGHGAAVHRAAADIEGIGLETIGVLTERGAIKTSETMQTNVPNVCAAGDVNGYSMLAHTAYREAEVAVNHMTGKKDKMRYNAIPPSFTPAPKWRAWG